MTGWYKAGTRWHCAHDGHDRSLCGKYPAPAGLDTVAHGKTCIKCSDLAAAPRYSCDACHDQGRVMVPHPGGWGDDDMPCPECSGKAYR